MALVLGFVCEGCSERDSPAPVVLSDQAEPADQPRPTTQTPVACDGESVDPAQLSLILSEPADTQARIRALEALAGEYASSATTRTRLGEALLRTRPPSGRRAATWFARALALHDQGCTLGERDHWATLEGAALSRMMQGDYEGAIAPLSDSLTRWPSVRATRYNLACARCQTGDLDGCEQALRRVLAPAEEPEFLEGEMRSRAHYVQMARGDSDLAPLRAHPARFDAVLDGEGVSP